MDLAAAPLDEAKRASARPRTEAIDPAGARSSPAQKRAKAGWEGRPRRPPPLRQKRGDQTGAMADTLSKIKNQKPVPT
ncbi:MAG: hypothetical protein NVS1B14_02330 [Vulcanimicrobiaceae bacterium]